MEPKLSKIDKVMPKGAHCIPKESKRLSYMPKSIPNGFQIGSNMALKLSKIRSRN